MLTNLAQIAVELEADEGTAETLEAADCIRADNIEFDPNIEPGRRKFKTSSLSPHASVFGKRSFQLNFDVHLVGASAAGTAPEYSDAIKACGFSETIVAGTSVTYKPASSSVPTVTLGWYANGKIYKGWGARGNVSLELVNGQPGVLHFSFQGADWSESDGSFLSPSLDTTLPPVFQGVSLTIDSYAAEISKLEIDLKNELAPREDANAASGIKSYVIADRDPTLSFDPANVLVADEDFLGNWRSGTLMALSATLGSVAGNTIALSAPKVQYQDIKMASRDGIAALEIDALLCRDSGDDEFQIQIT